MQRSDKKSAPATINVIFIGDITAGSSVAFALTEIFKNSVIFVMFCVSGMPKRRPIKVPMMPQPEPVMMKISKMDFSFMPKVLSTAISLRRELTIMASADRMLKAATMMTKKSISVMVSFSMATALKKSPLLSCQVV